MATSEFEIRFQDGDVTLSGVLIVPSETGPHPAIVFIHGSGPENRDGAGLYLMWKHFAKRGFACVSWDKPGVGESSGDWRRQSYEDRAREAIAGLRFIQGRKEIDPSRIILWGLSGGCLVCSLAAALSTDVAALLLVSSPTGGCSVEEELFRMEAELRAEKAPDETVRRALDVTRREMELIFQDASFEEVTAVSKSIENEPWFEIVDYVNWGQRWTPVLLDNVKSHAKFKLTPILERMTCPVLAIWGELDCTVPAERGREVFQEFLTKAGNRDFTLKVFPKADHGLFSSKTGGMREMVRSWKEQKGFVPGYLETMSEWLGKRFLPRKSRRS